MAALYDESGVPRYYADDSDNSSDSEVSFISSKEPTATLMREEYEEDVEQQSDTFPANKNFLPLLNQNTFVINKARDTLLIGLSEKQTIFLSGVFQLQIVKGGIVYNNTHYNASKDYFTMWHPMSNSIPIIQSSFYAGWDESSHIEFTHKDYLTDELQRFNCVIRIRNASTEGIIQASKLYKDVRYLWNPATGFTRNCLSKDCQYGILRVGIDSFTPLDISEEWSSHIDRLTLTHNNNSHDMRVIIIGGKNSGKSTFLRVLMENFIASRSSEHNSEDIMYLDLDPGQPEYSSPDCISVNQISCDGKVRGAHLGQAFNKTLKQYYIGSNSPQDAPTTYLEEINKLFEYLEQESYLGTSFVNIPGWIKGFGINILNFVIERYKPTNIVLLETNTSKKHFDELLIPSHFTDYTGYDYKPEVVELRANFTRSDDSKFNASQLRIFKTLAYFHTLERNTIELKYDFAPLVKEAPFQLSFGPHGIRGISFFEEFLNLHPDDLKRALEGTIVAVYSCKTYISTDSDNAGLLPILKNMPEDTCFIGLAIVHSIDIDNKFMNIYIPDVLGKNVIEESGMNLILFRGKTDTPLCEIFPPDSIFSDASTPFISRERRKKYEHVWKVRKNILRRGHTMQ